MSAKLARNFRQRARERMESLGITQAQLAKKMKVTPAYVSQMLNGYRDPGLESLENFATALDMEASELLAEKILQKVS